MEWAEGADHIGEQWQGERFPIARKFSITSKRMTIALAKSEDMAQICMGTHDWRMGHMRRMPYPVPQPDLVAAEWSPRHTTPRLFVTPAGGLWDLAGVYSVYPRTNTLASDSAFQQPLAAESRFISVSLLGGSAGMQRVVDAGERAYRVKENSDSCLR